MKGQNHESWAAIKAIRPTPVFFPVGRGQVHKRVKPKKRRPSPIARHLNRQHRTDPARTRHFVALLAARDRRRTPVKREKTAA